MVLTESIGEIDCAGYMWKWDCIFLPGKGYSHVVLHRINLNFSDKLQEKPLSVPPNIGNLIILLFGFDLI